MSYANELAQFRQLAELANPIPSLPAFSLVDVRGHETAGWHLLQPQTRAGKIHDTWESATWRLQWGTSCSICRGHEGPRTAHGLSRMSLNKLTTQTCRVGKTSKPNSRRKTVPLQPLQTTHAPLSPEPPACKHVGELLPLRRQHVTLSASAPGIEKHKLIVPRMNIYFKHIYFQETLEAPRWGTLLQACQSGPTCQTRQAYRTS